MLPPADPTASPVDTNALLDTLPWGVLLLAPDGRVRYLNQRVAAWWGLPAESVLGRTPAEVPAGRLSAGLHRALQAAATDEMLPAREFWLPEARQWLTLSAAAQPDGSRAVYWQPVTGPRQRDATEFRTIAHAAPALVWVFASTGEALFFNERWYDYTGQTPAQALGHGWVAAAHPDDWALTAPYWARCQQTGEVYEGEFRYRRHDGEYRWHVFRALPTYAADGTIEAWYGLSVDVHDARQADEALRRSEQQLRLLIEASSDVLYRMSPDWQRMDYLNGHDFLADTTSPDAGWLPNYIPAEEQPRVRAAIAEAIRHRQPFALEHRVIQADGSVGWTYSRAIPVLDEAGNVREWFGAASDVTLQRLAAQQLQDVAATLELQVAERTQDLRESQALVQSVFDSSPNALLVLRALRDARGQVVDFECVLTNPVARELYGYDSQAGRHYAGLFPGPRQAEVFQQFVDVADTGHRREFEVYYPGAGGPQWLRFVVVRLGDGIATTAENITEQRQFEQERVSVVMQAQEEERRRIAESLHNGLGQQLYAFKLQLSLLLDACGADAAGRREVERLLTEAIRQTRAISHELTPTFLETFGLEAALRDICRGLGSPTLRWHCHIVLDEGPALPPAMQLVLYRLAQELAQNIVKHAQATEATLELEVLPRGVALRAEDNGRGFDPATATQGLGLRTLYHRVALLGGTLALDAAPGRGTHVRIRFPLPTGVG